MWKKNTKKEKQEGGKICGNILFGENGENVTGMKWMGVS